MHAPPDWLARSPWQRLNFPGWDSCGEAVGRDAACPVEAARCLHPAEREDPGGREVRASTFAPIYCHTAPHGDTTMAASVRLGKLDAICAKLKSSQDPTPPPEREPSPPTTTESQENNNNNKSIADYNDVSNLSPSASSSCVPSPSNPAGERSDFGVNEDSMSCPGPSVSRRKKSRKSATPRNINTYQTYQRYDARDEEFMDCVPVCEGEALLSDQHNNGDDESFSCSANQGMDECLSSDVDISSSSISFSESATSLVKESEGCDPVPLDLSVPSSEKKPQNVISTKAPTHIISDRDIMGRDIDEEPESTSEADPSLLLPTTASSADRPHPHTVSAHTQPDSAEAQGLADFANNTVNELLSIYGFAGSIGTSEALTKNIPLSAYQKTLAAHRALQVKEEHQPSGLGVKANGELGASSGKSIFQAGSLAEVKSATLSNGGLKSEAGKPFEFSKFKISSHHGGPGSKLLPDYSKYIKRFSSGEQCGSAQCRDLGYRDHYHCLDCSAKVFLKKEEMVRHFKWHKKRDDSLQHGFLRYSSSDSCSDKFPSCTHNSRQTHYHCIQPGCDKVYISTSDVQMHANYHRKDSAIIMEGFQRFRATEDCGTTSCQFYGHRTTHFHCRRSGCNFTFKNKADMEKHKSYHQKDEILGRDGFKKFMKYEHCTFKNCRFSKISNHIHCIRPGCTYVLHSTAQLYSHKRKHERRDFEKAYQHFKQSQQHKTVAPGTAIPRSLPPSKPGVPPSSSLLSPSPLISASGLLSPTGLGVMRPMSLPVTIHQDPSHPLPTPLAQGLATHTPQKAASTPQSTPQPSPLNGSAVQVKEEKVEALGVLSSKASELTGEKLSDSLSLPIPGYSQPATDTETTASSSAAVLVEPSRIAAAEKKDKDEFWKTYLVRYTANDPCNSRCHFLYKDHYHCKVEGCTVFFKSKDGVREHAKYHELQDRITPMVYVCYSTSQACPLDCQYSMKEKHYHCNWTDCKQVIPQSGPTFARLEHFRIHEFSKTAPGKSKIASSMASTTSSSSSSSSGAGLGVLGAPRLEEETHRRRRGRPPKYPRTEIPRVPKVELTEAEIAQSVQAYNDGQQVEGRSIINGFRRFEEGEPCPDVLCLYYNKLHFHCGRPRCHNATDRMDVLNLHAKDFHNFVTILPGFEFFDRNVNCRRQHCHNNKANRHFHCTRSKCDYSFVRHSTMNQHEKKHRLGAMVTKPPSLPTVMTSTAVAGKAGSANYIPIVPAINSMRSFDPKVKTVVKAAGTFYPISGLSLSQGHGVSKAVSLPLTTLAPGAPVLAQQLTTAALTSLASTTGTPITVGMPLVSMPGNPHAVPMPLTLLLQQKGGGLALAQPSWTTLRNSMHYGLEQNCGRPFCKLKKKDHYHCRECNQAFSDPVRLRIHMGKHGIKFHRTEGESDSEEVAQPRFTSLATAVPTALIPGLASAAVPTAVKLEVPDVEPEAPQGLDLSRPKEEAPSIKEEAVASGDCQDRSGEDSNSQEPFTTPSSSLNLNPSTFSSMLAKSSLMECKAEEDEDGSFVGEEQEEPMDLHQDSEDSRSFKVEREETCSPSSMGLDLTYNSWRKRQASPDDSSSLSEAPPAKIPCLTSSAVLQGGDNSSSSSPGKDDLAPAGYVRFRFSEDCGIAACTYRKSVTHFHCLRPDCAYGFSDRSRLVQHSLRHERLDGLMGDDFKQYRVSVGCGQEGCEFTSKANHFHCLKCSFACADSSKVLPHRKYHTKLENISSHGFVKFTGSVDCGHPGCSYLQKQTHYHCTFEGCSHAVLGPSQMLPHKMKHAGRDSAALVM